MHKVLKDNPLSCFIGCFFAPKQTFFFMCGELKILLRLLQGGEKMERPVECLGPNVETEEEVGPLGPL